MPTRRRLQAPAEFDFDASTGTITRYNGYATNLAIPETIGGAAVKAIGPEAFAHHYYLALLELPEGLEAIGDGAFYNCATLGHVKFPSTLKTIGDNAFYNAYQGSLFELPSAETIGDFAFYFAGIKGSVALPDGLTSIGTGAFEACGNLGGTLYLPDATYSIELFACVQVDAYDSVIYNPAAQAGDVSELLNYVKENSL